MQNPFFLSRYPREIKPLFLHSRLLTGALWTSTVLLSLPVFAQTDQIDAPIPLDTTVANALTNGVRPGTPSVLAAVDTTMRIWSTQFQKFSIYLVILVALFAAYVTGRLVFEIVFASGTFGPRAASVGAWFSGLVLLFVTVLMLPQTWPWWAPYTVIFVGLLAIALLISSLSRKAA